MYTRSATINRSKGRHRTFWNCNDIALKKLIFYFVFIVPSDIQARGSEAVEAYNNALMDGKAYIKRVPIMIIGLARTGKTSLK